MTSGTDDIDEGFRNNLRTNGSVSTYELAAARAEVRRHIEENRSIDGLPISATCPPAGTSFALVSRTPKLEPYSPSDRSNWHRCSYCERGNQFASGSIVLCGDGYLRTIGDDCWRLHLSEEDWNAAHREHAIYERRRRFEEMFDVLAPSSRDLQFLLRDREKWHAAIEFSESVPIWLRINTPELDVELRKAANHDGRLTVERFVIDFSALEGRKGQRATDRDGDAFIRRTPQAVELGRFIGAAALSPASPLMKKLELAFQKICQANLLLRETEWDVLSDVAFSQKADEYETLVVAALDCVEVVVAALAATRAFFGTSNMATIVRWANDDDCELRLADGIYATVPRGFSFISEHDQPVTLAIPADFSVPHVPSADKLRKMLGQGRQVARKNVEFRVVGARRRPSGSAH